MTFDISWHLTFHDSWHFMPFLVFLHLKFHDSWHLMTFNILLHFPRTNLIGQILSLEYHRLYFHVRAALFLDLWGALYIWSSKHSNNGSRKNLCIVYFQYVICCSLKSPSRGRCMSGLQRPQPASCPRSQTCECFKEPSINVLKTRFDWNSIYWQLLGIANYGTAFLGQWNSSVQKCVL